MLGVPNALEPTEYRLILEAFYKSPARYVVRGSNYKSNGHVFAPHNELNSMEALFKRVYQKNAVVFKRAGVQALAAFSFASQHPND